MLELGIHAAQQPVPCDTSYFETGLLHVPERGGRQISMVGTHEQTVLVLPVNFSMLFHTEMPGGQRFLLICVLTTQVASLELQKANVADCWLSCRSYSPSL